MSFDTSFYYRLTNNFTGKEKALDVLPDGSGLLKIADIGNYSGQFWRLVALDGGKYALRTWYLGEAFSLDIINDGINTTPHLAETTNVAGQHWTATPWGDGTFRLTNDFTGPDRHLDVYSDGLRPTLATGDYTGQHWTLTKITSITANVAIPDLEPKTNTWMSEGPTDFGVFVKPIGTVKALMIFVDFPDAPHGDIDAAATAKHLLGDGKAQKLLNSQSYGNLTLDVTVKSDLGWRRMPQGHAQYGSKTFEQHRDYIAVAAGLFPGSEVKFADYALVFIVSPPNGGFDLSPAFNAIPPTGAHSPSGEIRHAVTFGKDSYNNRYINLIHETGHVFGLPDLYPYASGGAETSKAGCWPIMSDIFHSMNFLGWHRHKNGWLVPSRKTYLSQETPEWYITLSPLRGAFGVSMLVLPLDNAVKPSKVLVAEVVEPVLGTDDKQWGEGILVYTVDATVESGNSPIQIVPKKTSSSSYYGYLYEAPYVVGDMMTHTEGSVSVTLTVLQKFGSSYNVKVVYKRQ